MRNGKRSTELTSSSLAEHGTTIDGLRVELRQLALEPGKQLNLVIRETKGDAKATEKAARNLEEEKIDLIYTAATSVTLAAKRATLDTSIVFAAGADPVVLGLVDSFSSPETGSQAYSTGTAILPVNA
jgi:putative ABC transport system substrate-binding protein